MKCLACIHYATAEMVRIRTVTINGAKYNVYKCNVCGNKAFIPPSRDK